MEEEETHEWMTARSRKIRVGPEYQAQVPQMMGTENDSEEQSETQLCTPKERQEDCCSTETNISLKGLVEKLDNLNGEDSRKREFPKSSSDDCHQIPEITIEDTNSPKKSKK
eukprot:GHVP01019325.1.p1 GENE.GHVP01019325.1~~GHVP01019325.1.p1  ORF type:complete len:112 (-),score=32.23 GHVP01019325.1:268-603(-)